MLSSMLQPTAHKDRLGPMEPVEVKLPVFAGSTRQYSYHTQSHFTSSATQNGSPKHKKKSISRRSESKLPNNSSNRLCHEPNSTASKEATITDSVSTGQISPTLPGTAGSDKVQPKGAQERTKKSTTIPPRFRAENQRKLMNRKKEEYSTEKKSTRKTEKVNGGVSPTMAFNKVDKMQKDSIEQEKKRVTDHQTNGEYDQPPSEHQNELKQQTTIDLTLSLSSEPSSPLSRRSSVASSEADEEDLFQDALSYLPVPALCSGTSSTTSSAFVTPASSRSQSPVYHHSLSEDSLHHLLIELEQKEEPVKQTAEDSSSCGSRVTLTDDDSPVFPYTFTHHSEINDTPATETQPTVRHYSNDTVFQMVVGDIGIEINGQDFNKSSFEFPSSPVESSYDEHDSGCSMSIGSPLKSLKRPGLIYVPPELSQKISRGQSLEFSSLSTASHPSSICSSSPLSLSPSPTPLLPSSQTAFDGFQQWPDLSTKSATTNSSYPNGATHRPTQEDILRMEQWHSNLLAQLRQQQEKLDQKKKEKEAATESYSLPSQLHMFLPPNGIPPPPLHASLPPLPTHIPPPPLHGPLPPNFFPPFPPLPLHSVPPVFIPPPPPAHMFERHPQSRKNFIHPPPFTSAPKQPSSPVPSQTTYVLNDKWVLWYDKIIGSHKNSFSDYKASLKQICTVTSVEDFWKLFNNIRLPSALENSTNYHFFREGINPLWEDPANRQGGKWVLTIKEGPDILDRTWLEVLLKLIGAQLERNDVVNGVVVSRRKKGNRIAIWTNQKKKKPNLTVCKELVEALKVACGVPVDQVPTFVRQLSECKNGLGLVFMHHTDSLRTGCSYQNESHIKLKDCVQDLLWDHVGCR